jgi:hypothetical protein
MIALNLGLEIVAIHPDSGGFLHHPVFLVIPGRAQREPGIHNHGSGLWIPGLRQEAHPGMTMVGLRQFS